MRPQKHIDRLFAECHRIQTEGHCRRADEFAAINKVEIAVNELSQAFENNEFMHDRKRKV